GPVPHAQDAAYRLRAQGSTVAHPRLGVVCAGGVPERRHARGVHGRGGAAVCGGPQRSEVRGDGCGQLLPLPRRRRRYRRRYSEGEPGAVHQPLLR
ncbi:unnamed protein product, partial [Ectocarpus fasciculatus]